MSYRPRTFDPLDLEIIDRVYEAACARFEARMPPSRPTDELRKSLRKRVMTCAALGTSISILCTSKCAQASQLIDLPKSVAWVKVRCIFGSGLLRHAIVRGAP
jgi:hypothetical protein